jgi:hypothetical protein
MCRYVYVSQCNFKRSGRLVWCYEWAATNQCRAQIRAQPDYFRSWHIASSRCSAIIRQLSEAKRTLASQPRRRIYEFTP